jgi:ribosome-associated protein
LTLPREAVELRVSRSSGPGGQHANKTESRVEAIFDVAAADFLDDEEKERVILKAGPVIRAIAQDERSQMRNREIAVERLTAKLERALEVEVPRKPTKAPKGAVARSVEKKRKHSQLKQQRRQPIDRD